MNKLILILLISLLSQAVLAQDSTILKVHFLYGSKPHPKYKSVEEKWFGGVPGGHVGIEADSSNKILNFVRKGKFHWFPSKRNPHSTYIHLSPLQFYNLYPSGTDSIKKAIVYIPVTAAQKQQFDTIAATYLGQTPYDYALTGMRCAAATYEILAQLNILPAYRQSKTATKILYPKKLRTRLFALAEANNWKVEREAGSSRQIWDTD